MNRRERVKKIFANQIKRPISKKADVDQTGVFQSFQTGITNYDTREGHMVGRTGERVDREKLYGLGPEHKPSVPTNESSDHTLSTRYCPDMPGVQAARVSDGVTRNPYTNELYPWNSGFSAGGRTFRGGDVSLQTDLGSFAKHLRDNSLIKEARIIEDIISQLKK